MYVSMYVSMYVCVYVCMYIYIVDVIESAAYGVIFMSCLCENPNERGTSE